jgi:stage IV sporulation protein FB
MEQNNTAMLRFRGPWGVPIDVQPSFLFLLFLIVGVHVGGGAEALMHGAVVALIVLVSILLHEFGHAWGARVLGAEVKGIHLYGGGGFCRHGASDPRDAAMIVAMGPIVNLTLWALLSLGAEAIWASLPAGEIGPEYATHLQIASWLWFAAELNLMLFVLNMIPLQPLDGGKIAFFFLMRMLPEGRALQVAGTLGMAFAIAWIPAMVVLFASFGFVLLFFPSFRMQMSMIRAGAHLVRMRL